MPIRLIHLSDIHFFPGKTDLKPAFEPFLDDLERTVASGEGQGPCYLVVSGDLAYAGATQEHYSALLDRLDPRLCAMGIPRNHRIIVPGNHDASRTVVESHFIDHESIVAAGHDESTTNDYLDNPSDVFRKKFEHYLAFEQRFASYGLGASCIAGAGHTLPEGIGVFCANSAVYSSAGNQRAPSDKGRLAISTRAISDWLSTAPRIRCLVMHHPPEWLAQRHHATLRQLQRRFSITLSGHNHDQDVSHRCEFGDNAIALSAPALLSRDNTTLGYAILEVSEDNGPIRARYRQWSEKRRFVAGVSFAEDDCGVVSFHRPPSAQSPLTPNESRALEEFSTGLDSALTAFGKRRVQWEEPTLRSRPESERDGPSPRCISLDSVVHSDLSYVISAPPQFGLTCISWALCKRAILAIPKASWIRVDVSLTNPHKVREAIARSSTELYGTKLVPDCIVLDGWTRSAKNARKMLDAVATAYPTSRLVVLETIDGPQFQSLASEGLGDRTAEQLYVWATSRASLRRVVSDFAKDSLTLDAEKAFGRIISDLDALNLPRTIFNCLTLLVAAEAQYDSSPINRAEVIQRVLFLLFSATALPTYQSRPDVKDCEHVLGHFAEHLLRQGRTSFSADEFIVHGKSYCTKMLVYIEVDAIFAVLCENGILVKEEDDYRFRFAYWIYYFAAVRMRHDPDFKRYVLDGMQYTRFPEVIEFFTGIDRCGTDALEVLEADLRGLCDLVDAKCDSANCDSLFLTARWNPTPHDIEHMKSEVAAIVQGSGLSDEIKDQYADQSYDRARPYDQTVQRILSEYSFRKLTRGLQASARALRNSDFVDPDLKRRLLATILRGWRHVETVIVLIAPMLAATGKAEFDGTRFRLVGVDDAVASTKKLGMIFASAPANTLAWFGDDLYSSKLGPLLFGALRNEANELTRHNLALLVSTHRPRGWRSEIEDYIRTTGKNSFFLHGLFRWLLEQYRYAPMSDKALGSVADLVKMSLAKHESGSEQPGPRMISRISDAVLGDRTVEDDE